MPQQLEFNGLDLELGNEPQRCLHRAHGVEGLLVAVAVQQRLPRQGPKRQIEPFLFRLGARNSSNSTAFSASARAASLRSSAGISSRKPKRQLGSRPITGMPRSI